MNVRNNLHTKKNDICHAKMSIFTLESQPVKVLSLLRAATKYSMNCFFC